MASNQATITLSASETVQVTFTNKINLLHRGPTTNTKVVNSVDTIKVIPALGAIGFLDIPVEFSVF